MKTISKTMNTDDIVHILELDKLSYKQEYLWTKSELKKWVATNNFYIINLIEDKKSIGYLTYCYIKARTFNKITQLEYFNDREILNNSCSKNKADYLYIASIVIHPSYRGKNGIKLIMSELNKKIKFHTSFGITVSEKGYSTLLNSNFKLLKELSDGCNILIKNHKKEGN